MSSLLPNEDYLVKVLEACEEELVCELSSVNAVEMCKAFFQENVITRDMCDNFTSLDHSRLEPQLQIRYLLRLVRMNIKTDVTAWGKFLILLDTLGGISNTLTEKLKKPMPQINEGSTESADASVEEEIVLSHGDVGLVTELLVPISHEWEVISISLDFLKHDRENFRSNDNRISLSNSIECWISRDSNPTLKKLMQVVSSKLVGADRVAVDLEKGFKEAKKQSDNAKKQKPFKTAQSSSVSDATLFISKTSYHTEVADGKSTLLLVQASPREVVSYQWKKDSQPLPNTSTYSGVHDDILVVNHASQGTEGEYICCVSRQGKEVCTNKITLTVLYEAAKKRLINLYSAKSVIPEDTWPPTVSKVFINLALIKFSKDCMDIIDYAIRGDADDIIAKKEKIEYKQVFGDYNSKELILLEGRPGSGKTTLVHKVIKDWAEGEVLTKAKYLFFVSLRLLNSEGRDETLSDLLELFYSDDEELKTTRACITRCDGEGVCFVIDGLDEYQPQSKKKSVIYKLLNKTSLPRAMIIVSSRPSATPTLKKDVVTKRIEVFGFSKQQIFEYIDNFQFGSSARKLKEYLVSNRNILDMCYLPVHAAMICFLFRYDQGCTSCTQTKIYEQFTRLIIHRHLTRRNTDTELPSLNELHGMPKKYFDDLCHLAFNMTTDSKQVISPRELGFQLSPDYGSHGDDEYSLGLVTVYHTIHLTGRHQNYAFLHLTFQEFLAAYHIANLDTSQQMEIIELYSKSECMHTVWTFYCGLINFQFGLMRFKKLINSINIIKDTALLIRYGYESQQLDVCDEVVKHLNGELEFDNLLIPTDLLAISYVIVTTTQPVTELSINFLQYDDTLPILLAPLSQKNLHNLKDLDLSFPIYGKHLCMLINILKSATNLETIRLGIKDFGHDEAEGLVAQLKQLSSLTELNLHLTAAPNSIHVLVKALSSLSNIYTIGLSFEDVDTKGALALGSALQFHTSTKLHRLNLNNSNIGPKGVTGLVNGLRCLTALSDLCLENNEIGCDGFNSFWNGIRYLNFLETLILSHNNIVDDDIKFLANSLQHLTGLSFLKLSHMNLGSDWSCLVELRHLTNIRYLNLSHNDINFDGAASLACALQYLTTLESLHLFHNNIGPAGMTALSNGLLHLTNLNFLYISHNDIDFDGAKAVITSLKGCHNLYSAVINTEHVWFQPDLYIEPGIIVRDLISPDNTSAIADLLAAAECEEEERKLDLGFKKIHIPAKRQV